MFSEDQLLPLSGLNQLAFCPRRCALIHLEQCWSENYFTASGRVMHERVHSGPSETRGDVRTVRGLALRSLRLGLTGVADAVEFHRVENNADGVALPKRRGFWVPYPVEYKRGRPKRDNCDTVQLCAQAICLEEMLGASIPEGSLFYGETRHRVVVSLDKDLRAETERLAEQFHALILSGITPTAEWRPACKSCSLAEICMPEISRSATAYIERNLRDAS